jgi:VCBS repeat-containing protein
MTINVAPVNDLPVITSLTTAFVVPENTTGVTTVTATDIDLQPLSFSLAGADAGRFSINSVTGVLTFNPAPNFEAPADAGGNNVYDVTVVVSDGAGGTDSQALTVTVDDANDAPTAGNDAYVTDEELPLAIAAAGVLGNDGDEDGTPVTAVLVAGPANGSVAFNPDGSFVYTPNANFTGTDSFTYQASDGALGSATATVTITVNPINDAPTAADGNVSVAAAYAFAIADFNYFDVDGDPLDRIMITALPVEGQLLFDGLAVTLNQEVTAAEIAAGRLTYVLPTTSSTGAASFGFSVSDGTLYESASHTMTIGFATAVPPPPPPPPPVVITPPPAPPAEPPAEPPPADGAPAEPTADAPTGGGRGGGGGGATGSGTDGAPAPAEGPGVSAETSQATAAVVATTAQSIAGGALGGSTGFQSGGVAANPNAAGPTPPLDSRGEPPTGEVKAEMEAVAAMAAPEVHKALDELRERAQEDVKIEARVAGSVFVVSTSLSVGYVLWLLRGGALIASLLSSLPAWRLMDPLPVLGSMGGRAGEEDDDSLEDLVADDGPPSVPGDDALANNDKLGSVRT